MPPKDLSREAHFPAIEKKYGEKMSYWFKVMAKLQGQKYPDLELVIAWNQPMLKLGDHYVFGVSTAKNHILFAPWSQDVLEKFRSKMADLDVKKKTISVPNDWKVDEKLLQAMVKARIAETK